MLTASSTGPKNPPMVIEPKPTTGTSSPVRPSVRVSIPILSRAQSSHGFTERPLPSLSVGEATLYRPLPAAFLRVDIPVSPSGTGLCEARIGLSPTLQIDDLRQRCSTHLAEAAHRVADGENGIGVHTWRQA